MSKQKVINIRVESDLKKQAKILAENDGRSLSNWILQLIKERVKASAKDHQSKAIAD